MPSVEIPLPSLSPLTGTFSPTASVAHFQAGLKDLNRTHRRLLEAAEHYSGRAPLQQVTSLRDAAARHLHSLCSGSSSPFRRPSTSCSTSDPAWTGSSGPHGGSANRPSSEHTAQLHQEVAARLNQLTATINSMTGCNSVAGPATGPAHGGAASSLAGIGQEQVQQPASTGTGPGSGSGGQTPLNHQGGHSCAAALQLHSNSLVQTHMHQRPFTPGYNSRPCTPLSVHDLTFSSRAGTPKAARLRRLPSSLSASWSGPLTTFSSSAQQQSTVSHNQMGSGCEYMRNAAGENGGGRSNSRLNSPAGGGSLRGSLQSRMTAHQPAFGPVHDIQKVSRGMIYSVFTDLDVDSMGRMTYSSFEDAALSIGLHVEQAKRLFSSLDQQQRGYVTVHDWGSPQLDKQISQFTKLYIQYTRGANGRSKGVREVRNMQAAVEMALAKLKLRSSGRAVSSERLVEAFEFIDRDKSGMLDRQEVEDALAALGIYVTQDVLDAMMTAFDKDGNGTISYKEFLGTLFPIFSKSYKQ